MFSPELTQYAIMLLVALSVGGFVYALAIPYFNGEKKTGKRIAGIASDRTEQSRASPEQHRRKAVQKVLDDLDQRQKEKNKVNLTRRLGQAGLQTTPTMYYIFSAVSAVIAGFGVFVATGGNKWVALGALFVGGLGLPRWYINSRAKKRQRKFINEFANSIDIIVRGIKTGLPLNDCIKIIAAESPDPVGPEFSRIVEEQRIGVPLAQGIERLFLRIPLQEVNFLAIVISIQQTTGGNLAEALSNLSAVLRERKKLEHKVAAFSAEAKASAAIIGSLPLIVMGMVYISRPDYIGILFEEKVGNLLLIGSAIWMTMGVLVMRKMINFDF